MRKHVLSAGLLGALSLAASAVPAADPTPVVTSEAVTAFRHKIPLNALQLDGDPFAKDLLEPLPAEAIGAVCALRYEADRVHYTLKTFDGEAAARDAGYIVTHKGGCGTCSTLQDLAAYMAQPDLTAPVRSCALRGVTHGRTVRCLEDLGLSHACAETWYYNSVNTRRKCFGVCIASLLTNEPSNRPDGSPNDCLQCGEDNSGRVFKLVAGRSRRNSGIHSSIDRAETEVYDITHDYY
jgi:hypothetical protein